MFKNILLKKFYTSTRIELRNLFTKTFTASENESEGQLIGNLVEELVEKTSKDDIYVFASLNGEEIIASAIFTRLKFEKLNTQAFLLGPMVVHSDHQKKGIGTGLIKFAHEELKKNNIELVFTYGDINFYSKVGYSQISEEIVKAPLKLSYPEGWLAQSLNGQEMKEDYGQSYCVEGFNDPRYW